jgi:hypothetical protein
MTNSKRVMVSFPRSGPLPGTLLGYNDDGTAYVRLDGGTAANYPREQIRELEDKDLPTGDLETK